MAVRAEGEAWCDGMVAPATSFWLLSLRGGFTRSEGDGVLDGVDGVLDGVGEGGADLFGELGGEVGVGAAFGAVEEVFDLAGFVGLFFGDGVVELVKGVGERIGFEVGCEVDAVLELGGGVGFGGIAPGDGVVGGGGIFAMSVRRLRSWLKGTRVMPERMELSSLVGPVAQKG